MSCGKGRQGQSHLAGHGFGQPSLHHPNPCTPQPLLSNTAPAQISPPALLVNGIFRAQEGSKGNHGQTRPEAFTSTNSLRLGTREPWLRNTHPGRLQSCRSLVWEPHTTVCQQQLTCAQLISQPNSGGARCPLQQAKGAQPSIPLWQGRLFQEEPAISQTPSGTILGPQEGDIFRLGVGPGAGEGSLRPEGFPAACRRAGATLHAASNFGVCPDPSTAPPLP